MSEELEKFETWGIIEIFGHTQIAGKISEATIGGQSFIRVDVPDCADKTGFTKYYGNGAIYSMTPTSEAIARAAIASIRHAPINVFIGELPRKQLRFEDVGDDDSDDGGPF
jgi:hypothetical protein